MTPAQGRFTLRGLIAAASAMLAVAGTIWIDNPYVKIASAGVGALAFYLGAGSLSPQAEPFVGIKADTVEIPAKVTYDGSQKGITVGPT